MKFLFNVLLSFGLILQWTNLISSSDISTQRPPKALFGDPPENAFQSLTPDLLSKLGLTPEQYILNATNITGKAFMHDGVQVYGAARFEVLFDIIPKSTLVTGESTRHGSALLEVGTRPGAQWEIVEGPNFV